MNRKIAYFFTIIVVVVFSLVIFRSFKKQDYRVDKQYDLSEFQKEIPKNFPVVDLVFIHNPRADISWQEFKEEYQVAFDLFLSHGVHLNLRQAFQVSFPESWNGIEIEESKHFPQKGKDYDFYGLFKIEQTSLPGKAEKIMNNFVQNQIDPERTIFFVTLENLIISWFEKQEDLSWKQVSSKTSAISMPPYIFGPNLPQKLRGIITIQRSKVDRKTMAHELGHKLINVSHEGGSVCPHGDGKNIPGLMGYSDETSILSGREGRFHGERLLKSPFIYRIQNGKKVYNPEYQEGGYYDDPVYEGLTITPNCPVEEGLNDKGITNETNHANN